MRTKICAVCGKPFETIRNKYCSAQCAMAADKRRQQERAKDYHKRKEGAGKNNKRLIEANTAAREAGMTYGKYRARAAAEAVKVDLSGITGGKSNVGNRENSQQI